MTLHYQSSIALSRHYTCKQKKIGGGHFGYVTHLTLFPDAKLVVAHLTNSGVTALPRRAALHMADEILGLHKTKAWLTETAIALTKKMYAANNERSKGSFPKRVLSKSPAHELIEYAGVYDRPGFGTATVRLEAGQAAYDGGRLQGGVRPLPL